MTPERDQGRYKGFIKLELNRQGNFIFAFLLVFFVYFGLICNLLMFNESGIPINYPDLEDDTILTWTFLSYPRMFYIPPILLFLICFFLTYREDIPDYGIKSSIWLIPIIIIISISWHWTIFGISIEPLVMFFAELNGYLYIIILFAINWCGAISGIHVKKYFINRREKSIKEKLEEKENEGVQ